MFRPYHRFTDCRRLESLVKGLQANDRIPSNILSGYRKYHYALLHKLESTCYYVTGLRDILTDTPLEMLVGSSKRFVFLVNLKIDGFFYSGGSALDIFAREVLTYFGITLPSDVYYKTARTKLQEHNSNDALIQRLGDPPWKDEFSNYRNAITHELLISSNYQISVSLEAESEKKTIVFPLPDDPRCDNEGRTYVRNPDSLEYCQRTFRRLLSLINQTYREIGDRIDQSHTLPL